ncbi:MAG: hypothetical protein ACRDHL_15655, partial [Candidatus Promineifilaceae bacterium]
MESRNGAREALRPMAGHWLALLGGLGGALLALGLALGLGLSQGWYGLIPLGLAAAAGLAYLALAPLWAGRRLPDRGRICAALVELGRIRPHENLVYLDLGTRWAAAGLSRALSTGRIIALDVYNPQLMPGRR